MVKGWVYVLTNESFDGLVKVGFSMKDPKLRASEMYGTGLPYPFHVHFAVLVDNPFEVEQRTHKLLANFHESKEFFRTNTNFAVNAIRSSIVELGFTEHFCEFDEEINLKDHFEIEGRIVNQAEVTKLAKTYDDIYHSLMIRKTRNLSFQDIKELEQNRESNIDLLKFLYRQNEDFNKPEVETFDDRLRRKHKNYLYYEDEDS